MADELFLEDGHSTTYTFSENETIKLYEVETTPPGVDGGGSVNTTNMRTEAWRQFSPKRLKTLTNGGASAAYHPEVLDDVVEMINVNQLITVTMPSGATWEFWGWLNKFTPNGHKEGEMPLADCEIIPSNHDNDGLEVAPVYTPAA